MVIFVGIIMAQHISVMLVACSVGTPPDTRIEIHGTGLDDTEGIEISVDGVKPIGFYIGFNSPYIIHIAGLNPPFKTGVWTVKLRGVTFTQALICPAENVSGLYYIDRVRSLMQDAYNDRIRKIPNPTVRTALIGE